MKEKDAVKYYLGKERYNCAQAILKTYQEDLDITDEQILEYKKFGGGNAEGSLCGALFAVKELIKDEDKSKDIEQSFYQAAGATTCKEIRKLKKLSCNGCVEKASQLLSEHVELIENNKSQ